MLIKRMRVRIKNGRTSYSLALTKAGWQSYQARWDRIADPYLTTMKNLRRPGVMPEVKITRVGIRYFSRFMQQFERQRAARKMNTSTN